MLYNSIPSFALKFVKDEQMITLLEAGVERVLYCVGEGLNNFDHVKFALSYCLYQDHMYA